MNRRALVLGLLFVGLCSIALGLAWDRLVPSSAYWGTEEANELTAAQLEMHTKSHEHGPNAEQEMAVARQRYQELSQQLEHARGSQKRFATIFLAVGVLMVIAGAVVQIMQSRSE